MPMQKFTCDICNVEITNIGNYERHKKAHTGVMRPCHNKGSGCTFQTDIVTNLPRHQKDCTFKTSPLRANFKRQSKKAKSTKSTKTSSTDNVYTCPEAGCFFQTRTKVSLEDHKLEHYRAGKEKKRKAKQRAAKQQVVSQNRTNKPSFSSSSSSDSDVASASASSAVSSSVSSSIRTNRLCGGTIYEGIKTPTPPYLSAIEYDERIHQQNHSIQELESKRRALASPSPVVGGSGGHGEERSSKKRKSSGVLESIEKKMLLLKRSRREMELCLTAVVFQ